MAGAQCRAYANLDDDTWAEVRLDDRVTVIRRGPGAVVRREAALYRVWTEEAGDDVFDWQVLRARDLATGATTVLVDGDPQMDPSDVDEEEAGGSWYGEHTITIVGVLGPYVSMYVHSQGYAGGVHGYDDNHYRTLRVDGRRMTPEELLDAAALRDVQRAVADDAAERKESDREFELEPPSVSSLSDLSAFALSFRPLRQDFDTPQMGTLSASSGGDGPALSVSLGCCTWVENHNRFELSVRLRATPPALSALVNGATLNGPKGCPAYDLSKGRFVRGAAALPGDVGEVIGVTWARPGDPKGDLETSGAAEAKRQRRAGRSAMKRKEYAAAAEAFRVATTFAPGDGGLHGELGWALFLAGRLDAAEMATRKALTLRRGKKRGAVLYNLGRILEARGKPKAAIEQYRASLKVRPNKTVRARLRRLEAPGSP